MADPSMTRLELLLRDYDSALEDKRSFDALTSSVFAVGITLSAAIGALLTRACRPQDAALAWLQIGSDNRQECTQVSPYAMSVVPLIPVMVLAILLIQGMSASMRSRYVRRLELDIRDEAGLDDTKTVPYGSSHLLHRMAAGDGALSRRQALLFHLQWIPASIIAVGVSAGAVSLIDDRNIRIGSIFVYAGAGVLLISALFAANFRSGRLWERLNAKFESDLARTRDGFPRLKRYSARYVILPRPSDLIAKAPLHAVAFYVGAAVSDEGVGWRWILVFTVALEVVLYQARYAVNDLRDIDRDSCHIEARKRMRLEHSEVGLRSGLYAIGWRVAAVALFAVFLPDRLQHTFIVAVILLVVSTVLYETVKGKLRQSQSDGRLWARLLFAAVGVGYGVRVGAGLHLGGLEDLAVVAGAIFGYALGVMFVTMTWTLEAYAYGAREDTAASKPHAALLLDELVGTTWPPVSSFTDRHGTPLTDRREALVLDRVVPFRSTVFVGFVAATAASVLLGAAIYGAWGPVVDATVALGVTMAVAAAAPVFVALRGSLARLVAVFGLLSASALVGVGFGHAASRMALPLLLTLTVFTFFQAQRYSRANPDFFAMWQLTKHTFTSIERYAFWLVLSDAAYKLRFGKTRVDDQRDRKADLKQRLKSLGLSAQAEAADPVVDEPVT